MILELTFKILSVENIQHLCEEYLNNVTKKMVKYPCETSLVCKNRIFTIHLERFEAMLTQQRHLSCYADYNNREKRHKNSRLTLSC